MLGALALCLLLPAPRARAIDLEADLSTHYIEIRTNFQGAGIIVFGAVTGRPPGAVIGSEPIDLVVVVRGPPETVAVRRKERLGVIWANSERLTARNVPSFYSVAATRPLAEISDNASLERFKIGFDHLKIEFEAKAAHAIIPPSNPPANSVSTSPSNDLAAELEPLSVPMTAADVELGPFRLALMHLMTQSHFFREDGRLTFVRANLFRAEIEIPPTVPPGQYGAEVYVLQHKAIVAAEAMVFSIDKKGLEGDIYNLAHREPLLHGLLAIVIAVAAGWISELLLRRR